MKNLEHLSGARLDPVIGSVTDNALLRKYFSGVDYVFHEAAIASVVSSIDNPLASHEANLTGTVNVLQISREAGVKKVICASSCSIYGHEPAIPTQEAMAPYPQTPYAVTKLSMEYYCSVFQQVFNLKTVCLRYFNVFGPRQDPDSEYAAVVPRFIQNIREGRPPVIFGNGRQTRDFVFVKDVAAANLLAAESEASGVFNIGSGQSTDLNTLAELVLRLTSSGLEPVHDKARAGDTIHSRADISKARAFGFVPRFSLESGLQLTLHS